jgi:hypothetical protein
MNGTMDSNAGYFDPSAEAHSLGERLGRLRGKQAGVREGHTLGYQEGHAAGHQEGWDAGIACGNQEMLQQLEFTRQHIAEKALLSQQLEEQRALIEQLQARLEHAERENVALRTSHTSFREVVTDLQETNQRLRTEVSQLDGKHTQLAQDYTEQLWQYNHNMVVMNSVRSVIEDLARGGGPQATQVSELFARHYGEHVSKALNRGSIRIPPDKDAAFAKSLPNTHTFITRMLNLTRETSQRGEDRTLNAVKDDSEDHDLDM